MLLRKKRRRRTNVFFKFLFETTMQSFWRRTYSGARGTHEIFHVVVNYTFGKRHIRRFRLKRFYLVQFHFDLCHDQMNNDINFFSC